MDNFIPSLQFRSTAYNTGCTQRRILVLKASIEEIVIRGKKMFYVTRETQKCHMGYWTIRYILSVNIINGPNNSPTGSKTLWPWANIRWWHLMCGKKKLFEWEPNVATFTVLYHASPILLTFNILTFLYDKSVFRKMKFFAVWHRSVAFQITLNKKHIMKLH